MKSASIAVLVCTMSGCGLTFGADERDEILTKTVPSAGVEQFTIVQPQTRTLNTNTIRGERGAEAIDASLSTTQFGRVEPPVELVLEHDLATTVTMSVAGGSELVRIDNFEVSVPEMIDIEATIPSSLIVDRIQGDVTASGDSVEIRDVVGIVEVTGDRVLIEKVTGDVDALGRQRIEVNDTSGPVQVEGGGVWLRRISGPVDVESDREIIVVDVAGSVRATGIVQVNHSIPIDLQASGSVTGSVSAGGAIASATSIDVTVDITSAMEQLNLSIADNQPNGEVVVRAARSQALTLDLRSAVGDIRVDFGDVQYDSSDPKMPPSPTPNQGVLLNVNGGGPVVRVRTQDAFISVLAYEPQRLQ